MSNKKLFFDAIKTTYDKYGISQVRGAIIKIIKDNNYESITNGDNNERYRDKLEKNTSGREIFEYIKSTVDIMDKDKKNRIYRDDLELVDRFLSYVLSNELVEDFKNCCMVTYDKYDKAQLNYSILKKINKNDSIGFSRFPKNGDESVNYRDIVSRFSPKDIKNAMLSLLSYYGIDKTSSNVGDEDLIYSYTDLIEDLSQMKPRSR